MLKFLPRFSAVMLLLLGSIALAVAAREGSESFQQCQSKNQTDNGAEKKPKGLSFIVERIFAPYCTARFIEAHNAGIVALATILLTWVTGGLVWTGYLQIRTIRAQLRAYVFPDSALICDGMMLNPPLPEKANQPGVVLGWKNTGQTPAANVVSWGDIAVIEPINEDRLAPPKELANIFSTHLGAGAVGTKSLWFGRALTPNEIADVVASARAIYLYGRIEYRDIFGKKRYSNFCLAYSGPFPPPQGVIFNVCEKGNDAD